MLVFLVKVFIIFHTLLHFTNVQLSDLANGEDFKALAEFVLEKCEKELQNAWNFGIILLLNVLFLNLLGNRYNLLIHRHLIDCSAQMFFSEWK